MTKKTLKQQIQNATYQLLELAEQTCWNKISRNCVFILSEIKNNDDLTSAAQCMERKKINQPNIPASLNEIIVVLEQIYDNLYDINLQIYHAQKRKTIIDIRYFPKSSLEKNYLETVKNMEPMLHYKIPIPAYQKDHSTKYDVNWTLGGLRHKWNKFWWNRKNKY